MMHKTHKLPVVRQAQLLDLSRSSVYYEPKPVSEDDLRSMRRMDELHLEHPFAGARMLRDMLRLEGFHFGRKHVGTLMKKMGIEAIYRRSNTSRRNQAHRIYPYLLRHVIRSEEHTSDLQSLMRISYDVFCLQKKKQLQTTQN